MVVIEINVIHGVVGKGLKVLLSTVWGVIIVSKKMTRASFRDIGAIATLTIMYTGIESVDICNRKSVSR